MARIPQYTKVVLLDRSNPSNIDAAAAAAGGNKARGYMREAARAQDYVNTTTQMQEQYQQEKRAEGKLKAQERFNGFERERIKYQQEHQQERQANPTGFADEFDAWHVKQLSDFETQLKEGDSSQPFDIDYFRQLMDNDRNNAYDKNTNWESGLRVKNTFIGAEKAIDDMNANFALSNPTFSDYVEHQKKIRDYANQVGGTIFAPEDRVRLTEFGIDNAANNFFDQRLQTNPQSVKRVLEYGNGGREPLSRYIGEFEKGRGSKTPEEIDAAWDARLEKFEPAFQAIAYDALVSHGGGEKTWEMITKANGDPSTLITMRQEEYARLLASDPEKYGKQEAKWKARLEELGEYKNDLQAGGSDFLKNAPLVDSKILSSARKNIEPSIERKKSQIEKAAAEANAVDEISQIANQNILLDEIEKDDLTYDEKMLKINRQELVGEINQSFAADARRYLESKKSISAITNADLMADVVTQLYDLNAVAEMSESDYLRGVQNVKRRIMSLRADGTLSRDDEEKLNNQMRTLTAAKMSEATSSVAFSFGEANKLIEEGLPPELRGKATRELFYKVDQESAAGVNLSREDERKLYKKHARTIIDSINAERRKKALDTVDSIRNGSEKKQPDEETEKFLKERGYTSDDVKETAKKYGISEKQVIEHLKTQKK